MPQAARLLLLLALALGACAEPRNGPPATADVRALVFTRTTGFRHASIPAGIAAVHALGAAHGFSVEATEAPAAFGDANLARFRVVIFLNTTGDVLDDAQQGALERFIAAGNGFVGVHSAADTEYDWAWYGGLVGAYFASHPAIQEASVVVGDASHPSTAGLASPWVRTDEWYDFQALPPPGVDVLLLVDEASYTGGAMGAPHPIAWHHAYEGGRAWYTAMGHTEQSYSEPAFLAHLMGGIRWAAGLP
jgi:type 1 glutamine amidotransferase